MAAAVPDGAGAYADVALSSRERRVLVALAAVFAVVLSGLGLATAAPAAAAVGIVRGTLTGPDGAPAVGVAVSNRFGTRITTYTDANGRYSLSLEAGWPTYICWGADNANRRQDRGNVQYLSGCFDRYVVPTAGTPITLDRRIALGAVFVGTVRGVGGQPLDGARVMALRRTGRGEWVRQDAVRTRRNGAVRLTVPAGVYKLRFDAPTYVTEYNDDFATVEAAPELVVAAGSTYVGGAVLGLRAGIAGHVTPDGRERFVRTRSVLIHDAASGAVVRRASIGYNGAWHAWGLAAGSYKVSFNRLSGYADDAAQFWRRTDESSTLAAADVVRVVADRPTLGVDAVLEDGGHLVGTLNDTDGDPLHGCRIQAYTRDGSLVTRTSRVRQGQFDIGGLTTGRYHVRVLSPYRTRGDCDGGRQWLAAASGGPLGASFDDATALNVVQGRTRTIATPLAYQRGATITGAVTGTSAAGSPIDRTVVVRDRVTDEVAGTGQVQADGTYEVDGLPLGSYRVTFARVSGVALSAAQFFRNQPEQSGPGAATRVDITTVGQVRRGVDATLADGGTIRGRLVGSDGEPVAGCYVQAYTSDRSLVTRAAYTEADGDFDVTGLATGQYRLRVEGRLSRHYECRGLTRWYVGTGVLGDRTAAAPIGVTVGQTTTLAPRVVRYPTTASISGVVTRLPRSGRAGDRFVVVRDLATGAARRSAVAGDGSYSVVGLAPGSYRVAFNRLSGFARAAAQFYDGAPEGSPAAAETLTLTAGQRLTGIDATLAEGGHITGRLVSSDGRELRCEVQAYTPDRRLVTRSVESAPDGTFDVSGLSVGSYRLRVVPSLQCDSGTQFLDATGGGPLGADPADAVTVRIGALGQTKALADPLEYQVGLPPVRNLTLPSIGGTAVAGQTLTAAPGTWSARGGDFSYAWLADGVPIPGAAGPGLLLTAAQVGASVRVRVTISHINYRPTSATSAAVGPVRPAVVVPPSPPPGAVPGTLVSSRKPTIKGVARVGRKLKADPGATTPGAATVTFQWLRNGKVVAGATKASYRLVRADRGKKLALRVTYVRAGYTTLVVTSTAKKVKPKKPSG